MKNIYPAVLAVTLGFSGSRGLLAQPCAEGAMKCITESGGGDCASIGTWNAATRTCKLTGDLSGVGIQVAGDGVTLDGAGHTLTGASVAGVPQPRGIFVDQRVGVKIKNLTVRQFQAGVVLWHCSDGAVSNSTLRANARVGIELLESYGNRIGDNTLSDSSDGIIVNQSANNTLEGNLVESNRDSGIILKLSSSGNTVVRNITRLNSGGIALGGASHHNNISNNEVTGNRQIGVGLYFSSDENTVSDNRISGNAVGAKNGAGVLLMQVSGNRVFSNTVAGNSRGIWLSYPDADAYPGGGNQIYHNNFIDNGTQALITGWRSTPDSFSKLAPIGGNFWGNWTTPDADGDGVVDSAYLISGGGDNLPWRAKDGWVTLPDATPRGTADSNHEQHP